MLIQWMKMFSTWFILYSIFPFYPYSESLTLLQRAMLQAICQDWNAGSLGNLSKLISTGFLVIFAVLTQLPFLEMLLSKQAWGLKTGICILGVNSIFSTFKIIKLSCSVPTSWKNPSASNYFFAPDNTNQSSQHMSNQCHWPPHLNI